MHCRWWVSEWKLLSHVQLFLTPCDPMDYSSCNSPGQNTGVDSLSLFQGDLSNPGIEPRSPVLQAILYQLSHRGSPRILEWVAYPFCSRFSRPRNQTRVSCIGRILYQLSYQGSPIFSLNLWLLKFLFVVLVSEFL